MNLVALPVKRATDNPKTPFARHHHNSQWSTLVVVICGDGELLTSAPSFVEGQLNLVRTGLNYKLNYFQIIN